MLQAGPRDTLSNKPEDCYHIGQMQNFPEDLVLFVRKNSDDPLTKVCGFGVGFMYTILTMAVMTGSPRQLGRKQMVRWSERS